MPTKTTTIQVGIAIKFGGQMAEAFSVDQTVFQSSFASSGQRTSAGANEFSESSANAAHVNVAAQQENDARTALLSSVFSRSPDQQNPKFSEVEPFSTADRLVDLSSRRLPSPEFDSIAAELARRSISLDLCLVIPMYNEAKRIAASIKSLAESALSSDRVGFVFVDDGSTDSTVAAARCAIEEFGLAQAQVLVLKANLGKGGAVRAGILTAAASAHYVGYLDADLSLDPSDVAAAFTRMRASDAEVLVGDRIVDATHQPKLRRLASLTFRSLAAMAAPTGVRDTQCAMKLFRANVARNVFEPLQTNGFGFDVEVLVRARAIGARVDELPIAWTHTEGSSVNAAAESYRMMRDVLKVRRALLNG